MKLLNFLIAYSAPGQFADTILGGDFPSACCTHRNNIIFVSNSFNRTFLKPRIIFPPPEQRVRIEKKFQPSFQTLISASGSGSKNASSIMLFTRPRRRFGGIAASGTVRALGLPAFARIISCPACACSSSFEKKFSVVYVNEHNQVS